MRHRTLLLALSLIVLAGCSTTPPGAQQIPPPPVALISRCAVPPDMPEGATGQDLAEWAVRWVGTAGCERAKRTALIEAWPR
jgi:uncharacterized lipoprotein